MLQQGKKLDYKARRTIVRIFVDHIIEQRVSPGKSTMQLFAQRFYGMFPCLMEGLDGNEMGAGFESFCKQLINRAKNLEEREIIKGRQYCQQEKGHLPPNVYNLQTSEKLNYKSLNCCCLNNNRKYFYSKT